MRQNISKKIEQGKELALPTQTLGKAHTWTVLVHVYEED